MKKTSKYIHTLQIAIYFIEMENISKHISYFYISGIGPQYFSLKGFQFFILILSLFLGNKLYMLYILPRMENISILQTHYLFFISGIGPQFFSLQKCSISSSQFSPSIWTSSYLGREVSPFFCTHFISYQPPDKPLFVLTVCNAHSHYLF